MRTVVAFLAALLAAAPASAQPIRVGFSSAISGPSASTGEGVVWGGTMAVEDVNAKGGVMGRKVEVFFADNKGTPGEAVSAVRKLVDVDKVDVIIGQTHSGACLGAMPIIKELGVPQVTESCSNPKIRELSGKGGNEWQFRVALDDTIMANTFSKYIAQQVKSVSVIAQNDDFGRGAAAAYDAAFKKFGVALTSTEYFDRGQPDYRPLLTKIKRANPDGVLLAMQAGEASIFLRQFRELGLRQRIYARGSVATVEFLDLVKDNPAIGDGVIEATYWTASLDPEWEKRWLERWKTPVRVHGSLAALTFKYAVVPAIELSIVKYGRADRRSIRDALEQIDVKDTPLGPIKFDEYHQAYINMVLVEMKGGQLRILEKLPTSAAILQ
ncbi:MAG TPA: ABC transporter substrate-binding protein [Candidatus Methylomirabilis sp.]|nr:ABC transporter substrate-binding protein [Candidatus Methylomirabilis sp.]